MIDDGEDDREATETRVTVVSGHRTLEHPLTGLPRARVGLRVARAGFSSFLELAEAMDVSPEYLSRVRHGEAMGSSKRRQLAELLGVPEDEALSALRGDPEPRTPDLDAHRVALFSVLTTRIEVLNDEEADDENELRTLPGMIVPHETWDEVAARAGCSVRTIARIRRGADVPTANMLGRLSHGLLTPPELALFALRRPWTAWRW